MTASWCETISRHKYKHAYIYTDVSSYTSGQRISLVSDCTENLKLPACDLLTSLAMASRNMNIS